MPVSNFKPLGVYRTTEGWAAFDKEGRAQRVSAAEAAKIAPGKVEAQAAASAEPRAPDEPW